MCTVYVVVLCNITVTPTCVVVGAEVHVGRLVVLCTVFYCEFYFIIVSGLSGILILHTYLPLLVADCSSIQ